MASLKNKKKLILFVLGIFAIPFYLSANYSNYYNLINKAEEKFVLNKDKSCYEEYDVAFKKFKPFLKDPFIASQIAFYLGDTLKCYSYLKICFNNGMPLTSLSASPLFVNKMTNKNRLEIKKIFNSQFRNVDVDSVLLKKINIACFQSDSIKLIMGNNQEMIRKFFDNENSTRKFILENYLVKGIFINERILGITTDSIYNSFLKENHKNDPYLNYNLNKISFSRSEIELRLKCPFNIIIHSHCFFMKNKGLFLKSLLNGYIHPKEFGILEEQAILFYQNDANNEDKCPEPEYKICYNINGRNPFSKKQIFTDTEEGVKIVEKNRKLIFMQKYSIDKIKLQLEKELGITFFFDFINRP